MNNHLGARKSHQNCVLNLVGNGVGAAQQRVAVKFQVELDKGRLAGGAGAQIVNITHLSMGERDIADLAPRIVGQLMIHQQVEGAMGDLPGREQNVSGDGDGKNRIGEGPAELPPEQQRNDNRAIDEQVAQIVERIRLDRDGTGLLDHATLKGHQDDGCHDGYRHHDDAKTRVLDRRRVEHPVACFDHQEYGRAADKGALAHRRERLGLAMAEAMLLVRRSQGRAHREQVEQRGGGIQQGIDQRREQADGIRHHIGEHLQADESQRHGDRGIGGQAHQPPIIGCNGSGWRDGHG